MMSELFDQEALTSFQLLIIIQIYSSFSAIHTYGRNSTVHQIFHLSIFISWNPYRSMSCITAIGGIFYTYWIETLGHNPVICVLTCPPGDSVVHSNLKIICTAYSDKLSNSFLAIMNVSSRVQDSVFLLTVVPLHIKKYLVHRRCSFNKTSV